MPYSESNLAPVVKAAAVLNNPPALVMETHHDGPLPSRMENIAVSAENVVAQIIKFSEDNPEDLIIRVVETSGFPVETDILLAFINKRINVRLHPQEVKTMLIAASGVVREVNFVEL